MPLQIYSNACGRVTRERRWITKRCEKDVPRRGGKSIRIHHVIPFIKVTHKRSYCATNHRRVSRRIITRFLAVQSNRACVNYRDDRPKGGREEKGIGQLDFAINFSPRFAQLARWSREGTDANRNLEKRFDLEQSSLSFCLSGFFLSSSGKHENTWATLPLCLVSLPFVTDSYSFFFRLTGGNRICISLSTLNYSTYAMEGNSMFVSKRCWKPANSHDALLRV